MAEFVLDVSHNLIQSAIGIGADGNQLAIIDTLAVRAPFLEEGYWTEADDFNSHHYVQALTEPTGSDTRFNKGVAYEAGTVVPVTEILQGLRSMSKIDTELLRRQKDPQAYRASRNAMTVRGMRKTFNDRVLYGNNATHPDRVNGVTTRYNLLALANVVGNGGSSAGATTSIWIVKWGLDGLFFTMPRNGQNFIVEEDLRMQLVPDDQTTPQYFTALVSKFTINFGVNVGNPGNVRRICNIDATHQFDPDLLIEEIGNLPDGTDNCVIYVPRPVMNQMNIEASNKSNAYYAPGEVFGRKIQTFFGLPVIMNERIVATETVVA
jgi:hypothetical protein